MNISHFWFLLTQIQPLDTVLLANVRARSDIYYSVVSTSSLLYLSHPNSQLLRRPLTITLPCPPNPEKRWRIRGQGKGRHNQQISPLALTWDQPASPYPRVRYSNRRHVGKDFHKQSKHEQIVFIVLLYDYQPNNNTADTGAILRWCSYSGDRSCLMSKKSGVWCLLSTDYMIGLIFKVVYHLLILSENWKPLWYPRRNCRMSWSFCVLGTDSGTFWRRWQSETSRTDWCRLRWWRTSTGLNPLPETVYSVILPPSSDRHQVSVVTCQLGVIFLSDLTDQ